MKRCKSNMVDLEDVPVIIEITRKWGQDASMTAMEAARQNGTECSGNLRWWHGTNGLNHREINTKDGRVIRVNEPDLPFVIARLQTVART